MWKIEYAKSAVKQLRSIDRVESKRILTYLNERIAPSEDPRVFGEGLKSNLVGLWRYRVGNYRVVAEIQEERLVVLVVRIAHRREVYGGH